ncbi:hypothetical protein T440DRAFT_57802 [Plenodomus tracheiphilus IPT5]|uniref:Uncharacterized protein n=1 Tax=Plenodomus tracheiphilus IPT5 TaxID=1408161 RepID=A0A6A7BBI0_9PLEO|nr:hypothetical protein T440DRAFT_57802 [Plenodomus tracheiphilus IPT5]
MLPRITCILHGHPWHSVPIESPSSRHENHTQPSQPTPPWQCRCVISGPRSRRTQTIAQLARMFKTNRTMVEVMNAFCKSTHEDGIHRRRAREGSYLYTSGSPLPGDRSGFPP